MDRLNCCVVGYGGIATFHAEALRKIEGVCLHTVVGRRPEPTEAFQKQMGFQKATVRYEEALDDPEVHAVIVTAPSEFHHEMTAQALRAGKDVLVEIPLALSRRGAEELAALARQTGRKVMVAHTRRFQPTGEFVRDFLASGKAGKIHQHASHAFWLRHDDVGWTGYRRSWVDDVLFHHTCHHLDFALWAVGAPARRVRGELSPLDPRTGTSLDVSLLMRHENECITTISLSYNARQASIGYVFICEGGTLTLSPQEVTFGGEVVFTSSGGLDDSVLAQNREFVAAVRENRQPSCNAEDGLKALILLQEVYDQMVGMEGEDKYRRRWGL
ncbi:MAG: Gfo/Idh/MocA family oxidoreductase [Candidatus Latescibacteria bacterium]|nr:Gfo/Idh/MocA family oxidoreductase [Candidatus Latescibacterota bacterium]